MGDAYQPTPSTSSMPRSPPFTRAAVAPSSAAPHSTPYASQASFSTISPELPTLGPSVAGTGSPRQPRRITAGSLSQIIGPLVLSTDGNSSITSGNTPTLTRRLSQTRPSFFPPPHLREHYHRRSSVASAESQMIAGVKRSHTHTVRSSTSGRSPNSSTRSSFDRGFIGSTPRASGSTGDWAIPVPSRRNSDEQYNSSPPAVRSLVIAAGAITSPTSLPSEASPTQPLSAPSPVLQVQVYSPSARGSLRIVRSRRESVDRNIQLIGDGSPPQTVSGTLRPSSLNRGSDAGTSVVADERRSSIGAGSLGGPSGGDSIARSGTAGRRPAANRSVVTTAGHVDPISSPKDTTVDITIDSTPSSTPPPLAASRNTSRKSGTNDSTRDIENHEDAFPTVWESLRSILAILFVDPIDPTLPAFRMWLLLMDLLHIAHWIVGPIFLAWSEFITDRVLLLSLVRDLLLLINCWLHARFLFNNEYGLPVYNRLEILNNFLFKKNGVLQIIGALPVHLFGKLVADPSRVASEAVISTGMDATLYGQERICAIIFFLKIMLGTPYSRWYNLNFPNLALPISRFLKTLLILMMMGHLDACLFWFLDSMISSPTNWVQTQRLIIDLEGNPVRFQTQYLVSYLTALRSLVLKLRDVNDDAENVFVIFEFVAGILAYGTVFGNIHSIVEMLDKTAVLNQAEELHNYQMDWLKSYMREKKLRPDLQQMVTAYKEIQWQRSKGMDEELLFSDIPRSVQQDIKNYLYLDLVKKVPAFVDTDTNFQHLIAFKIKAMVVLDGWYIFRKGDDAEEMFFIKSGRVEICGDQGQIFTTLQTGQFFGEIALFEACKRTASARAKGNVELCSLSKESFTHIMNTYPSVAEKIRETIAERKRLEKKKEEERKLAAATMVAATSTVVPDAAKKD